MTSFLRKHLIFGTQKDSIGDIKYSVRSDDHFGWLICDGRDLNTTTYSKLFAVIGYSFGGSGDTFKLPNPAGRVIGVTGQGSGLTERELGDLSGTETHSLTESQIAEHTHTIESNGSHTHTITDPGHSHNVGNTNLSDGNFTVGNPDNSINEQNLQSSQTTTSTTNTTGITINSGGSHTHTAQTTGSGEAFSIMQPTIFIGNTFIYSGLRFIGTSSHKNQTQY
jgi:microcystin-dependent protein